MTKPKKLTFTIQKQVIGEENYYMTECKQTKKECVARDGRTIKAFIDKQFKEKGAK